MVMAVARFTIIHAIYKFSTTQYIIYVDSLERLLRM